MPEEKKGFWDIPRIIWGHEEGSFALSDFQTVLPKKVWRKKKKKRRMEKASRRINRK